MHDHEIRLEMSVGWTRARSVFACWERIALAAGSGPAVLANSLMTRWRSLPVGAKESWRWSSVVKSAEPPSTYVICGSLPAPTVKAGSMSACFFASFHHAAHAVLSTTSGTRVSFTWRSGASFSSLCITLRSTVSGCSAASLRSSSRW